MTITLPHDLHAKAVERAKRFGFPSVEAYVADLVEGDVGEDLDIEIDHSKLSFRSREELERLIQEGIDSGGAIEVNEEFWQRFREKIKNGTLRRARQNA